MLLGQAAENPVLFQAPGGSPRDAAATKEDLCGQGPTVVVARHGVAVGPGLEDRDLIACARVIVNSEGVRALA